MYQISTTQTQLIVDAIKTLYPGAKVDVAPHNPMEQGTHFLVKVSDLSGLYRYAVETSTNPGSNSFIVSVFPSYSSIGTGDFVDVAQSIIRHGMSRMGDVLRRNVLEMEPEEVKPTIAEVLATLPDDDDDDLPFLGEEPGSEGRNPEFTGTSPFDVLFREDAVTVITPRGTPGVTDDESLPWEPANNKHGVTSQYLVLRDSDRVKARYILEALPDVGTEYHGMLPPERSLDCFYQVIPSLVNLVVIVDSMPYRFSLGQNRGADENLVFVVRPKGFRAYPKAGQYLEAIRDVATFVFRSLLTKHSGHVVNEKPG